MRGYHTDRHLLIIESDDWGSIRVPSEQVFENLKKKGDHPEKNGFLRNDSLENTKDLKALYEVLSSVYDKNGNPAIITANFAMANPNFDKIDYDAGIYEYEPFYETYKRYYPNEDIIGVVKKGISDRMFFPQLHCREHLNVNRWMQALGSGKSDALLAFENKMLDVYASYSQFNKFGYSDAFNTDVTSIRELSEILNDACRIFEEVFEFKTQTFVASCFVWATEFEKILSDKGIKGIQSASWQNCPSGKHGENALKHIIHYTGQKNKNGQVYTVRNCAYEPSYNQNPEECVELCFKSVRDSFESKKPAIINSHRFNYISTINPANAQENMLGLRTLLSMIKEKYQDVEFITTPELVDMILKEKK